MGLILALSNQTLLVTIISVLIIIYIIKKIHVYIRLSHIPGPLLAGFSEILHTKILLETTTHDRYTELNDKYGPLVRVGPNTLITSSPEALAHIYKQPGFSRTQWFYHALRIEHRRDNVFSQIDNEKHEKRRKQMAPGYSGRENFELENSIDTSILELITLIRSKYLSTHSSPIIPMDIGTKLQYLSIDVITSIGFGQCLNMLKSDSDIDGFIASADDTIHYVDAVFALGLSWITQAPFIGRMIMPSENDAYGMGKLMNTCFKYVDSRVANPTDKRSDMLASFIRHGITGDDLRSESLEQVLAGSETTSIAMRMIVLNVISNPRVYNRLQQEIDTAVSSGLVDSSNIITGTQAKQIPYLQAVLREGMRIWTPVGGLFPRDTPPGGDNIPIGNGQTVYVPGGVAIGQSAMALHRNREVYGDDYEAFRPERWLEGDKEKVAAMVRVNDMVFGGGRWHCLGKPIAQLEMAKAIFELFRNFDISLVNAQKPLNIENRIGLFVIKDFNVQIMEREQKEM